MPRRRRTLQQDVAVWSGGAGVVVLRKAELAGSRLSLDVEFHRGLWAEEEAWQSAVRRRVPRVGEACAMELDGDPDGVRVRCLSSGRSSLPVGAFSGAGKNGLSARFIFERAGADSRVSLSWLRVGFPEVTFTLG
jgi:hypothetical protein